MNNDKNKTNKTLTNDKEKPKKANILSKSDIKSKHNINFEYERKLINKLMKATNLKTPEGKNIKKISSTDNELPKKKEPRIVNSIIDAINKKRIKAELSNHNPDMDENENQKMNPYEIPKEEQVIFNKDSNLIIDNKITNEKDKTYIFAMGGLEEIGKNMYVIEHNNEIIVVDVGIKFASSNMLGVNGIIPNFDYFKENNKKITKLIITHGHEDHIGGMPYIIKDVQIDSIISPLLAAELIKRRVSEFKEINKVPQIDVFDDNTIIKTKYFTIDFFRVCHSIPDCFGLCIQTPNGNIMSAGDYRFDFGKDTDDTNIHKIIEMSNRGIDLFLAESTNSGQAGFSDSEDNIIENINSIMLETKGRIFIATFASNLGRIEKIIERGININKKICIMGRSMEANIKTSRKVGYLRLNDTDFVSPKEINSTPDNEILVILTGSQGEEMAALNLMAEGKYSKISLKPSDTIVLSSNPIPGNFKNVELLVNKLFKLGVNVIQHSPSFKIHASGHATKQEQQMMMKLIKPKYIFPIHGEAKMLTSMRDNAVGVGFDKEQVIIATNGQKIELFKKNVKLTNNCIDTTPMLINGKSPSKLAYQLIEDRKKISEDGIFMALINIDRKNNTLIKNPMLATRGCLFAKTSTTLISKISYSIKEDVENSFKSNPNLKDSEIEEIVKKNINMYIWKNKKKNPVVLTTIFNK